MYNDKEDIIVVDDDDLIDDSVVAEFETSGPKDFSSKVQHLNVNRSFSQDTSEVNVSALCCDEEFSGFDKVTGKKWIYPNNYPLRDYQFNIIKAAILKNTLVSLPTGLGKTFIAAVLMYNYYRWYPLGKIVFTAPTRPLIAQQIEACYNIIALPPDDTIEMTGSMNIQLRKENWVKKRVFFATPQVVYNDIKSGICPAQQIRCLVIDEAHKAKSNYAYCQIVSTLTELRHLTYRILALSATPGSTISDVIQVVKNLQIAHLEIRSEECIDVAPYCFRRSIKTVIVPLDPELLELRHKYMEILNSYGSLLMEQNIVKSSLGNLSKGRILMIYKEFQTNGRSHPQRSYIMLHLSRLITLYHALELLMGHGSRTFFNFFDEHSDKTWIQSDARIVEMLEDLRQVLGVNPLALDTNAQPDGTISKVPSNLCFGHPKFTKVKEIIENHFMKAKEKNEDTRAIVFCEYHYTVKLVHCLLLQCRPLVNPRIFVGQGTSGKSGRTPMPQKEQLQVMLQFRVGTCNVLVATSVAEEGLDVGSVDLIVCFDVATRSPIRLVQRCGRTGRERTGQVHFLVTEGREHRAYEAVGLSDGKWSPSPMNMGNVSGVTNATPVLTESSFYTLKSPSRSVLGIPQTEAHSTYCKSAILLDSIQKRDNLNSKILQSKDVQDSLYKLNHRLIPYEITPQCQEMFITRHDTLIQNPTKRGSPVKARSTLKPKVSPETRKKLKKSKQPPAKPNKKNADIRALLLAGSKSKKADVQIVNELLDQDGDMSTKTLSLYFDLAVEVKRTNSCYICANDCDCENIHKLKKRGGKKFRILKYDNESTYPDISLMDDITASSLLEFVMTKTEETNREKNRSLEICNDSVIPTQCNETRDNDICGKDEYKTLSSNFDIGDYDDIFVLSPREEEANKINENIDDKFLIPPINFDLGSFDDLEDLTKDNEDVNELQKQEKCILDPDNSRELEKTSEPLSKSPSILSGSRQTIITSPILRTQSRKPNLNKTYLDSVSVPTIAPSARKQLNFQGEQIANMSNSLLSITQTLDLINSSQSVTIHDTDEGKLSPILLTQADRKKKIHNYNETYKNDTQISHDVKTSGHTPSTSTQTQKRKVDDVIASPYFNKRTKYDDDIQRRPTTPQEKIFAVLSSNDLSNGKRLSNNAGSLNCNTFASRPALKENKANVICNTSKNMNCISNLFDQYSYSPKREQSVIDIKTIENEPKQMFNNKISKNKKVNNSFIDLEAELSEDGFEGSADEVTDDSAGSLVNFVTDEDDSPTDEDMHALYLKSVKSPIKTGGFKIPQVPANYNDTIYSQCVEQDSYELDSFCVDSNVGLTQANDLSNLEIAEIILEEEKKRKKISRVEKHSAQENDSPVIKPKKNARRFKIFDD